jgi:predicted AAA+ superfamily ATPase
MLNRKYIAEIIDFLPNERFAILQGARQVGKTTLLKIIKQHCDSQSIPTAMFTLEQTELLELLNENPLNIFKIIPKTEEKLFVFIDEFQYLNDPSHFLKLLYDLHSQQLKIFVTGSSAFYLDQKFKDSLAGRKRIFNIYPLDFEEYLEFKGEASILKSLKSTKREQKPFPLSLLNQTKLLFEEYIIYGGYPEVVLSNTVEQKKEYLLEITGSYLKKDMIEAGVKDQADFVRLYKLLSIRVGQLINASDVSKTLGIPLDRVTNYLYILQKSFHIYPIRPFFNNRTKELTKQPKIFFNDSGLINQLNNNFQPSYQRADRGEFTEQIVFSALRHSNKLDQIKFWRNKNKNEVDFIINEQRAIEVKYQPPSKTSRGYEAFKELYPSITFSFAHLDEYTDQDDLAFSCPAWLL